MSDTTFTVLVDLAELHPDATGEAAELSGIIRFRASALSAVSDGRIGLPTTRSVKVEAFEGPVSIQLLHHQGWSVEFGYHWELFAPGFRRSGSFSCPDPGTEVSLADLVGAQVTLPDGSTVEMLRGEPGVGIASITDDDRDGIATVTLTDGTTQALPLPAGTPGDPGDDGRTPVLSWEGTALRVDDLPPVELKGERGDPSTVPGPPVKTYWQGTALVVGDNPPVELKGDPGDPGQPGADSTVPGPANSLTIGTVTTGAAGSSASAQITGTSPNQVLSLTIPRGAAGPQGPTFGADGSIIAAGRPDVASSMDTTTQAAASAAPVGTFFRSTDGAGVGAWVWMKRPTGWVVIDMDTGKRDITALWKDAAPFISGRVIVRRFANLCTIDAYFYIGTGSGGIYLDFGGASFTPDAGEFWLMFLGGKTLRGDMINGKWRAEFGGTSSNHVRTIQTYPPLNMAPPTTLPGTPA